MADTKEQFDRAQRSWNFTYDSGPVLVSCPKCSALQEDFDGFGVLYCEKCGYCTHASIDGNVCGLCKKVMV